MIGATLIHPACPLLWKKYFGHERWLTAAIACSNPFRTSSSSSSCAGTSSPLLSHRARGGVRQHASSAATVGVLCLNSADSSSGVMWYCPIIASVSKHDSRTCIHVRHT
jgi:hypothetical protein